MLILLLLKEVLWIDNLSVLGIACLLLEIILWKYCNLCAWARSVLVWSRSLTFTHLSVIIRRWVLHATPLRLVRLLTVLLQPSFRRLFLMFRWVFCQKNNTFLDKFTVLKSMVFGILFGDIWCRSQLLRRFDPGGFYGRIRELGTVLHELVGRLLYCVCKRCAQGSKGFWVEGLQWMLWSLLLAQNFPKVCGELISSASVGRTYALDTLLDQMLTRFSLQTELIKRSQVKLTDNTRFSSWLRCLLELDCTRALSYFRDWSWLWATLDLCDCWNDIGWDMLVSWLIGWLFTRTTFADLLWAIPVGGLPSLVLLWALALFTEPFRIEARELLLDF